MTSSGQSSHVGAVLSMTDVVAVLYGEVLNVDPKDPEWSDRDRWVMVSVLE